MGEDLGAPPAADSRGNPGASLLQNSLNLYLLGPVQAEVMGQRLRLRSRKARAALGYLAFAPHGEETRERLVGLLWSESEEERARASLRQVVHELREAMGKAGMPGLLRAERLAIGLDTVGLAHDAGAVLAEAEAGRVHPRLLDTPRLPDTLLEGLDDLDPSFRVWLLARRQAFQDRLMQLLEPQLRSADPAQRQARRLVAQAVLRLDPTHEEACRALMEASAAEGDIAAALRAYEQLWTLLDAEYDMEPSAATQALVADIKSGRFEGALPPPAARSESGRESQALRADPPSPAAAAPQDAIRIALLVEQFSVNGVPPERAHLVEGFRHELIACLVRFREWFIVDGLSMPDPAASDSRVSSAYRIATTAYQAGGRISMMLTLTERKSGVLVWSERMDLSLEGWFEAQQRIVRQIAATLNMQISAERLGRLATAPDVSLDAHDRWLRAQAMIRRFSPENWERARQLFTECIEETPQFSPAHSGLAQMDNSVHIAHPGVRRTREREARALAMARQAVLLDHTDSRAQLALGWSFAMAGRHAQAATHMQLAVELNPGDSWTLIAGALFHAFTGDHLRAEDLADRALAAVLAPGRAHWAYQVSIAYLRGDDEAAIDACDRATDAIPTLPAWRAAALFNLGRKREAEAAARHWLGLIRPRWFAESGPPTDEAITAWLLHLYPMSQPAGWERLRRGVAGAGLPTAGLSFGFW
jgi:DNA-binding SARP family transcriptional activator/TolB-like protein